MENPEHVVLGKEPVLHQGNVVGYVTSAYFGHTIGKQLAYAWVPAALSKEGTSLSIRYFDQRLPGYCWTGSAVRSANDKIKIMINTKDTLPPGTIGRRRAAALPEQPPQLWKNVKPKKAYDAIIVGGGGHGLATAYYLAKNHGLTNIAVLEKGWLAGGNTARNTTIIRSNYLWDESAAIYEHSLKLWETLEEDLGYEMFFSQRGVLTLAHSVSDVRSKRRNFYANALNGIDSEWLTPEEVKKLVPIINISPDVRYPVHGATYQPRGGIAKHDWVAWGYAKAASDLGVDIIQGCEVNGFDIRNNKVHGVQTSQGNIAAGKIGLVAAGHSSLLANLAGFSIPIQSRPLQALVSPLLGTGAEYRGDEWRCSCLCQPGPQG